MNTESLVSALEREWDFEDGFFGRLRQGHFDLACLSRLTHVLDSVAAERDAVVNRRLVSLLWYMPIFMQWQRERVQAAGGDLVELDKATNRVQAAIERILGVP
jgi:hypothetical protein